MSTEILQKTDNEQWALIELMGHGQTAGRIEHGNLLKVDVPTKEGFATEFYSLQAIYRIRLVSEEIARAHAPKESEVFSYNAPIVTREQHQSEMRRLQLELNQAIQKCSTLQSRLTAVDELVELEEPEEPEEAPLYYHEEELYF